MPPGIKRGLPQPHTPPGIHAGLAAAQNLLIGVRMPVCAHMCVCLIVC